jgi:large subunit ribosomal protein L10
MENPRAEKVAVVDEVKERLSSSSAALLTEYRGINVSDMATLRRALRAAGGEYKIYKNTLVRFAVRDLGLEGVEELLLGPTAIAFVEGDAVGVAKALRDFARTNPNLVVKGGLLGDKVLAAGDVGALADLPSREVLLARLAGALAAPMQQMAGLLAAVPRNFAYGLQALIDQGGAAGSSGAAEAAPADVDPGAGEAAAAGSPDPSEPETRAEENPEPVAGEQEPAEGSPPSVDETPPAEAEAPSADGGSAATPDPSEQEPAEGSPATTEES